MSRPQALMRLQHIDSEIDAQQARQIEIERALAEDGGLSAARAGHSAAQTVLAASRRSVRSFEAEVQLLASKAREVELKLYSGRVTIPKELEDLQSELASLKRRLAALEDQQLEAMMQVEGDEASESSARQQVERLDEELRASQSALADAKVRLEASLASLAVEREAAALPVPSADRHLYQALRQRKRGLAVAVLDEGACSACGVAPSSSRAQAARQGDVLIFCGNCERVLYAG